MGYQLIGILKYLHDPEYYKHQQALFIDFYNKGLISRKETYVNWDPIEKTVLANEQVINGRGWRSNAVVERKKLSQWFFNITEFADELLKDLDNLPGWPDKVKLMQKNWIGKSLVVKLILKLKDQNEKIKNLYYSPRYYIWSYFYRIVCRPWDLQ